MGVASTTQATSGAVGTRDLTGRSRMLFNVLFTWAGQMVYFAAGFVMPRMVDRALGQEVLGVWDFCWSLTAYFRFIDMGITSSVNRYVARCWGQQDIAGINRVVSSATAALVITAGVMLIATIAAVVTLPYLFADRLGEYVGVTQKSVLWLGVMLSVGSALGGFNGVLTGCHRWELQTMRNTGWYMASVVGMLVALWLGAGLVALAAITAICNILAHMTLVVLAYRVCPGLKLRRSSVDWKTIKELYVYGGKTLVPTLSDMLMNQTVSVLMIGTLGPGALAVFTRPRSLLRQLDSLERKMAMILVPTTSSMDASGQRDEIQNLMTKSVRYSIYLVLPLVAVLVAFGGEIMHLWMGPNYANRALPAILAIGFLGTSMQTPIFSLLSGLNLHGRAGMGQFAASAVSAIGIFAALKVFHLGLEGAALTVTLPLLFVNLLYLPMVLCRRLGQDLGGFYRSVVLGPVFLVLPFVACLGLGRLLFETHLVLAVSICAVGGATLIFSYWNHVLPLRLKSSILGVRTRMLHFVELRFAAVMSRMTHQNRALSYTGTFSFVGVALIAIVVLVPDASRAEHLSLFAIATESTWSHAFDWQPAWCSVKIVLLSISAIALVWLLLIKIKVQAGKVLWISVIFPALLAFFGCYELAKAIF